LLYLNRAASQLSNAQPGKSFIFSALESAVEFSGAHCGKAFIVEGEALTVGNPDNSRIPVARQPRTAGV